MKTKFTLAHWIGILALVFVLAAGIFVARWVLSSSVPLQKSEPQNITDRLTSVISPKLLDVIGGRAGDSPRTPNIEMIESLLPGAEDLGLPSEDKLFGLTAQTRETLRLRYNLGLLKFHQGDTEGALSAFRSVLEIDPQGAYGMRSFIQIGIIYSMQENYNAAVENFMKAVVLSPEDPLALHNLGVAYMRAGKINEAIQNLSKAAALDGANIGILQNLGNVYSAANNPEAAKRTYQQALQIEPDNSEIRFNLGLIQYKTGDLAGAEESFEKAASRLTRENKARAYALLGMVRYNRGFFGAAANAFNNAAELEPIQTDYKFNQAVALAKSGMYQEAVRAFKDALSVNKNDPAFWFGLGSAYYMNGQNEESLQSYNKGLEIDSTATAPLFTSGYILMESGKIEEAAGRFRKVIELGGADAERAHVNLGLCFEAMGRYEDAEKEYRQGTKDDPRTFYNLGLVRRRLGDKKGAVDAFLKAVELKPDDARYSSVLGDAYFEADMLPAAISAYEKSLKNGGDDFEILIRIVQLYTRMERIDEAMQYVKRLIAAASISQQKARAYLAEGLIFDRRGDMAAALHSFHQAVEYDQRNSDAYYNLGVVEARLRSYDRAVDALRVAIKLKPDNAQAHTQLGNIFAARGLKTEAIKEYETAVRIDSSAVEAAFNLRELSARP